MEGNTFARTVFEKHVIFRMEKGLISLPKQMFKCIDLWNQMIMLSLFRIKCENFFAIEEMEIWPFTRKKNGSSCSMRKTETQKKYKFNKTQGRDFENF